MIQNVILAICWFIFIGYWIISSFFVKKSMTKFKWHKTLGWRILLIIIIIIFVRYKAQDAALFFNLLISNLFLPNVILEIIATFLVIIGLLIAVWARIYLGRNWSSYVTYKKNHELVTSGPYKYVRHPIYSGVLLMIIGTFMNYGSLYILLLLMGALIMFLRRVGREEEIMIKLFGKKYRDYMKKTNRLIPGIW